MLHCPKLIINFANCKAPANGTNSLLLLRHEELFSKAPDVMSGRLTKSVYVSLLLLVCPMHQTESVFLSLLVCVCCLFVSRSSRPC